MRVKNGFLKKKDLRKFPNLKKIFTLINQHLYGKLKYTHTDTRNRSKEIKMVIKNYNPMESQ